MYAHAQLPILGFMKFSAFASILFVLSLTGCTGSSPKEQIQDDFLNAKKLIVEQKYKKAITALHRCAKKGHGGCAQLLGSAYYAGKWVALDIQEATKWLSRAYQTRIAFDFAGLYGAVSMAAIVCDPRNQEGGYEKHRDWVRKAKTLLELLAAKKSRMHSKTEKVFSAVIKKISLMDKSVTADNCKATY